MPNLLYPNVRIAAIASAAPMFTQKVVVDKNNPNYKYVINFIKQIGVQKRHISNNCQSATDLGFAAACEAIRLSNIEPVEIDGIVFATQTPDFNMGTGNAHVLHNQLKLKKEAFAIDLSTACSGFPYALSVGLGYLRQQNVHNVLIVLSDIQWCEYSNLEELLSERLFMFGEAAGALLLSDNGGDDINISLYADGSGYKYLFAPNEGRKNRWNRFSFVVDDAYGEKEIFSRYMNGMEITSFSTVNVTESIKDFMSLCGTTIDNYDYLALHQANKQIINTIGKRLGFEKSRILSSLEEYGNTDCASIPVTIVHNKDHYNKDKITFLTSGFGSGLSWGVASIPISKDSIGNPIFIEDGRFTDSVIRLR